MQYVLAFALLAFTGWLGLADFERRSVYPFDPTRVAPATLGLPGITERAITVGEARLIVWVAKPRAGQPTVLYFHGNAGNLANRADRFARLTARGYGLIAPAYRGSSGSTGTPSEPALTRDAQAVYDSLDQLIPGLTPAKAVLYGESLGSAVALKLAATRPRTPPLAVVLEAPFTSLPDVIRATLPSYRPLIPLMKSRWMSKRHAASLTAPLLVLHGTADPLIPIQQGRQVYTAAPSVSKNFLAIDGAGHSDTWRPETLPALWRFIDAQADSSR